VRDRGTPRFPLREAVAHRVRSHRKAERFVAKRVAALSPLGIDALRCSRCVAALRLSQSGLRNLQRLYPAQCRAPQGNGALRGSRTACRIDRSVPNTEAFRARIQHHATGALKAIFFGLLFFWASKRKVTRPPAGGRNARCVSGQVAGPPPPEGQSKVTGSPPSRG